MTNKLFAADLEIEKLQERNEEMAGECEENQKKCNSLAEENEELGERIAKGNIEEKEKDLRARLDCLLGRIEVKREAKFSCLFQNPLWTDKWLQGEQKDGWYKSSRSTL